VARARSADSAVARRALSELCEAYWYPLYCFARRRGCDHHEAEDLTQGFFLELLRRRSLDRVARAKGRFRSFLLASLKHFMANDRDRSRALKRGGGASVLSIDMAGADRRYDAEPSDAETPDVLYARRWATTLLKAALDELRAEYVAKGRADLFDAVRPHLVFSGPVEPYRKVADLTGLSEGNIKVSLFRMRRRYAELLRRRIAETVESEADVDDEIRYLMACFSRQPSRDR
jgi:RNA polymerase sigma-70 factor (ECF subfamily)